MCRQLFSAATLVKWQMARYSSFLLSYIPFSGRMRTCSRTYVGPFGGLDSLSARLYLEARSLKSLGTTIRGRSLREEFSARQVYSLLCNLCSVFIRRAQQSSLQPEPHLLAKFVAANSLAKTGPNDSKEDLPKLVPLSTLLKNQKVGVTMFTKLPSRSKTAFPESGSGSSMIQSKTWPRYSDDGESRSSKFVYGPLEPWETRLLVLLPGRPDDALFVEISPAALTYEKGLGLVSEHRNVEYEALSYTWGDQTLSHGLYCGDTTLRITANLATALVALRQERQRRYLWVDALCINQRDNEEKASQIRNMKLIYGRASNVVVWLGLPGSDTVQAAHFLNEVALEQQLTLFQQQRGESTNEEKEQHLESRGAEFASSFVTQHDAPAFNSTLRGLFDLGRRQWLSRVWILQEVYAASRITVRCGFCEIEWLAFSRLDSLTRALAQAVQTYFSAPQADATTDSTRQERTNYLNHFTTTANAALSLTGQHTLIATDEVDAMIKKFHYLRLTRSRRDKHNDDQDRTTFSLLELLVQGTHLQASDDRDRIFALLGLTLVPTFHDLGAHNGQNGIRISYNRTVSEVFQEVTKFIMLLIPPTTILLALCTRGVDISKSSDINLPTWCPDWRNLHPSFLLPFSMDWVPPGRLVNARREETDPVALLREHARYRLQRVRTKSPTRKDSKRKDSWVDPQKTTDDSKSRVAGHFFQQDPTALATLKVTGWQLGYVTEIIARYASSSTSTYEMDAHVQVGVHFSDWAQDYIDASRYRRSITAA
nr:heterokaryon incompatibility protein 6, or allele [Quercus suber]